jgi:hypothetical protein
MSPKHFVVLTSASNFITSVERSCRTESVLAKEAYVLLDRSGQTKYKVILKMLKFDVFAKYLEMLPSKRTRYDIAMALMEIDDHKGKFEFQIPEPEPADIEFSSKMVSYGMQHEK